MLITEDNLLQRLEINLASADYLELAVAWAGPGKALSRILDFAKKKPEKVRSIIGISGNATYPRALADLQEHAQLRIPGNYPLFHPKLFLFHKKNQTIAWVGSANLTRCGFEQNFELVSEVTDDGSYVRWFEDRWDQLEPDPSQMIKEYTAGWKPPAPVVIKTLPSVAAPAGQQFEQMLSKVNDWRSFVNALKVANEHWPTQFGCSVDGDVSSWLNTINLGHEIITRQSWDNLSNNDYRILMGIEVHVGKVTAGYGLLGSMGGAGDAKNVFREASSKNLSIRNKIHAGLQPALGATADQFPQVALDFIDLMNSISGFSGGIATRFLTLARPDFAVSVNRGSQSALAEWSGLPSTSLNKASRGLRSSSYASLLKFLAQQSWYTHPEPYGAYERALADARAALLDCLVYRPTT